jgi:hypothetical protein
MSVIDVWIFVDMINTRRIKQRTASFYAVHFIPFVKQKLGEVSPVLSCNSRD